METVTLAVGQRKEVYIPGNYLYAFDAQGPVEVVLLDGDSAGETHNFERKTIIRNKDFQRIRVRNLHSASNTIELWAGHGDYRPSVEGADVKITEKVPIEDATPVRVNVTNPTASATIVLGNQNNHLPKVSVGAGATVQIAAANANRKELRVTLPSDAGSSIAIGQSGMVADQGGLLEPGTTDYIATEGALYARNPGVAAVDVWVMEINRV